MKTQYIVARPANAKGFFESEEISNLVCDLAMRWQDEQFYEDIADYQKQIQTAADKFGIRLRMMTKQPFGFIFTSNGKSYRYWILFLGDTAQVFCKRISEVKYAAN